jgi:3-oxoacyl-[acyl-carrier protein] reductase
MKLEGRSAIVTGASQGLGRVIAEAFLDEGAHVLICARSADTLEKTRADLAPRVKPGQKLVAVAADVSKPADADRIAAEAIRSFGRIDALVNNAGVYGPMGPIEEVDWAEWSRAVEINLMGTVLPCRAVLPHFKKQKYGKIVNLSGGGATAPLPRISAYAASKAAVVRFTETLAEEVRADRIDVNAVAPGALNTRLLEQVLASGPEKVGEDFYKRSLKQRDEGGTALAKGAALTVFLSSSASDGLTGKLLSAVWDPWDTLPARLPALAKSDIYTLRRIVPKDRGEGWG